METSSFPFINTSTSINYSGEMINTQQNQFKLYSDLRNFTDRIRELGSRKM